MSRPGSSSPSTGRPTSRSPFISAKPHCRVRCHQGRSVVLISSGAALAGSPVSGGYAGSKRTQLFIANYSQKESDRLGLGLRFAAVAPRITPDTDIGKHAVAAYSRYLGISAADFIASMASSPTASGVASAVIELATNPDQPRARCSSCPARGSSSCRDVRGDHLFEHGDQRSSIMLMTAVNPSQQATKPARAAVWTARRTVSPRAQTALLPHAGFPARGR